jgi:hypothetical protein
MAPGCPELHAAAALSRSEAIRGVSGGKPVPCQHASLAV